MRMPLSAVLLSAALLMPVDRGRYSPEDYEDLDRDDCKPRPNYRRDPQPMSAEAMEKNQRIADEKAERKSTEGAVLKMLKEENPRLSGKAIRKKLKELRKGVELK